MIRIWQSYSCNNSSSYRLVARFTDGAAAKAASSVLAEFFAAHAKEVDARERYHRGPSDVQRAFASKYGFAWNEIIMWGDEGMVGDEPELIVHDDTLVVFHYYCGGGLGDGVPSFLAKQGAEVGSSERGDLDVTVVFQRPTSPALDEQLDAMAATVEEWDDDPESNELPWIEPVPVPWETKRESYGHVALYRDAATVGLVVAIDPRDLSLIGEYLTSHGVTNYAIAIDREADGKRFRAISRARCKSCEGTLEYLDPRIHDIETPQLVCRPCGGFYELGAFTPA